MSENPLIFIKPSLAERFHNAWESCRVILFSAPCGCGKTVTAAELLRDKKVFTVNKAEMCFSSEALPKGCEVLLIDDLQLLSEPEQQQALCRYIRHRPDLHFVLLGRGHTPGWLMPFQLAGIMQIFVTQDLLFDRDTSRKMLESRGVSVSAHEMGDIHRDMMGYPIALELLSHKKLSGARYDVKMLADVKRDLFIYYDEAVFSRFDPLLRKFLLSLAPFDRFDTELAKMVSGEARAGKFLGILQLDTTMLLFEELDTYRFRPIFREFLLWKTKQVVTDAEKAGVFSRAALYFELHEKFDSAIDCYAKAGETDRVSALLIKNAEMHPGVGHYQELQDYYFSLHDEEILRSPALICGMSMLTAMPLDYEASERWYNALKEYVSRLKKSDAEYREASGKLAYLDIALPQRGSRNLIGVINSVFHVMLDKQLKVPSFSVTSVLPSVMNGGKDFCEWSKCDDLLYATMRVPVETVLGKDGVGLADCAICESKFEKGKNVSEQMLALMARLGEIQARGTTDIEFAVIGLLARIQISQGKAETALQSIKSLREQYEKIGETRFLANIDALCARIHMRLGDESAAVEWLEKAAPQNDARLWAMWRYQYLTRIMVQIAEGETEEPLLLLARLASYCDACGRIMDALHVHILTALCRYRQNSDIWREEFSIALDRALEYKFIWPIAQYGAAILPMLRSCGWKKNEKFLEKLDAAARTQAVFYPKFLKPATRLITPLSSSEMQVLRLLCQNLSNQEIGEILNIKLATVKTHVSHILQKLNVQNRSEAKEAAETLRLL